MHESEFPFLMWVFSDVLFNSAFEQLSAKHSRARVVHSILVRGLALSKFALATWTSLLGDYL